MTENKGSAIAPPPPAPPLDPPLVCSKVRKVYDKTTTTVENGTQNKTNSKTQACCCLFFNPLSLPWIAGTFFLESRVSHTRFVRRIMSLAWFKKIDLERSGAYVKRNLLLVRTSFVVGKNGLHQRTRLAE